MKRTALLIGLLALALSIGIPALLARREPAQVRARLVVQAEDTAGYRRAEGPRAFEFPRDHGPHPDYQAEWWYYTGNLETADGRHFGYQLTFFRRALLPPAERQERPSAWAAEQAYMAHFALSDAGQRRFRAFERLARGAAGLAGAQATPYQVWLEDWSAAEVSAGRVRLLAEQDGLAIDLLLADEKGPVLQGERGYSQKGPEPGNASYYYSQTRLATTGSVRWGEAAYPVEGWSWMDREWSTSGLSDGQVGWDWLAFQLDDGSELMLYQMRRDDGSIDPFSSGTFVAPDGATRHLARDDFSIDSTDTWRSPRTGAVYPAGWTIRVPALELALDVEPYLADQELDVSIAYWEGAVRLSGERSGRPVRGDGFVELTGYVGSIRGQF